MEKRFENPSRRPRNNRSGGGNRNRNRNRGGRRRSGGGGNRNSSGNQNRNQNQNRNRNRNRSRRRRAPKQTPWQKFLSKVTFGLLGKPKQKPKSKGKPTKDSSTPRRPAPRPAPVSAERSQAAAEVTTPRLYVGNLDYATTESELEDLFRGIGQVCSAEVVTNARTQQSKGFAFVEMISVDDAKRAVEILDDEEFMGRKLIVSGARSEGPRDSEDEEPALAESAPEENS